MKVLNVLMATSFLTVVAQANPHQGFYVGLTGGYSVLANSMKVDNKATGENIGKNDANASGPLAGLSVMYLHALSDSIRAGVELGGDYHFARKKLQREEAGQDGVWRLKMNQTFSYSAAAILGYAAGSALPYVKLGVQGTKLSITGNRAGVAAHNDLTFKSKKNPFGFLTGFGVLINLTDSFALGAEYACTLYSKKIRTDDRDLRTFTFKPTEHAFKLKLAYKF